MNQNSGIHRNCPHFGICTKCVEADIVFAPLRSTFLIRLTLLDREGCSNPDIDAVSQIDVIGLCVLRHENRPDRIIIDVYIDQRQSVLHSRSVLSCGIS